MVALDVELQLVYQWSTVSRFSRYTFSSDELLHIHYIVKIFVDECVHQIPPGKLFYTAPALDRRTVYPQTTAHTEVFVEEIGTLGTHHGRRTELQRQFFVPVIIQHHIHFLKVELQVL